MSRRKIDIEALKSDAVKLAEAELGEAVNCETDNSDGWWSARVTCGYRLISVYGFETEAKALYALKAALRCGD